jgi:hypothetical protein
LPEERFWKRHSPHGEAPLSLAGSVALHGLVIGALLLAAVYLTALLFQPERSLPIEPVRLDGIGQSGKDGGKQGGPGNLAENLGGPQGKDNEAAPGDEKGPPRVKLTPAESQRMKENFDPSLHRAIENSPQGRALARLEKSLRDQLMKGLGGQKGGGKDGGPGQGKIGTNKRIERMLRWNMHFTVSSGREYLAQLRGLGAILAIPVAEKQYKFVTDLRPGAPLVDKDLSAINCIYWIDDKPASVRDLMAALGLDLRPSRFVAFMPTELEETLYRLEREYVTTRLKVPFQEDRIDETHFRVVSTRRGYRPEVLRVTLKP